MVILSELYFFEFYGIAKQESGNLGWLSSSVEKINGSATNYFCCLDDVLDLDVFVIGVST